VPREPQKLRWAPDLPVEHIEVGGNTLRYIKTGKGPNLVLLHTLRSCYRLLTNEVFHNRLMLFALPGAREELLAQHRAIHDAVAGGDADAARAASIGHIDFIERALADAERSDEWRRVSRLRLSQRSEGGVAASPSLRSAWKARVSAPPAARASATTFSASLAPVR
jgi:hypothetical protein